MVASFLSFLSPQEETEDDLREVGGQVQVRWAVCQRVAVAKGSGTEDSELSAVACSLGGSEDFQALLVITQLMDLAPWPGCGGAFSFVYIV